MVTICNKCSTIFENRFQVGITDIEPDYVGTNHWEQECEVCHSYGLCSNLRNSLEDTLFAIKKGK